LSTVLRRFVAGALVVASGGLVAPTSAAAPKTHAPEPSLPPIQLALAVSAEPGGALWHYTIENKTNGPVRLSADPMLFSFELTPPATETEPAKKRPVGPKTIRCVLPDDTRPTTDEGQDLVMPSGRSWSGTIDPIFYCFGAKERAALVAGTQVKPTFGFASRPAAANQPPFAAAPVGASVGRAAPVKLLEGAPFTLSEASPAVVGAKTGGGAAASADGQASAVTLSVPETLDASRAVELSTTVTLTNGEPTPITVLFRPDMLLFSVSGPNGSVACGVPRQGAVPIRELFTTIGSKQKTQTTVLFSATCSAGTFDNAGIYRVWPRLDTTGVSGRSLRMRTWDGVAVGNTPLLLRVRAPRRGKPSVRPSLD
jgi:hypothetical protein